MTIQGGQKKPQLKVNHPYLLVVYIKVTISATGNHVLMVDTSKTSPTLQGICALACGHDHCM